MADFTPAQIGQRVEQGVGSGVVEGPNPIVSGLSLLAGLAPTGQELQARREAEQQRQVASVVDEFRQESLKVADAVEMGSMTSSQARMRQRALFSRYTANNPMIADEITKAHEGIVKTVGMGKVIAEGNEQEQQERRVVQSAIDRGWVTPSMSRQEQMQTVEQMRRFDLNQELVKDAAAKQALANAQLEEQSKRVGITNAQLEQKRKLIGLEMDNAKLQATNAAYAMQEAYGPINSSQIQDILTRSEGVNDPALRSQLLQELDSLEANTVGSVQRNLGRGGTSDQLSNVMRPMQLRFDSARRVLSGEIDKDSFETSNAISLAQEKYSMLLDPKTRAAVATTSLFGEQVVLSGALSTQALTTYTNAISGVSPQVVPATIDSAGVQSSKEYMDSLRAVANAANIQQLTEQSMEELRLNVDAVLGNVADSYRRPATSFNTVAQALASPEMGEYISQHGSIITSENAVAAKEVLQTQYADVVLPLIQDEWNTTYKDWRVSGQELERRGFIPSNLRPKDERDVRADIRVDFSGGGVVFRANRDLGSFGRTKLNQLNKTLAPTLNSLIRLGSHLEGNTNYRKFYEDNYAAIFDGAGTVQE